MSHIQSEAVFQSKLHAFGLDGFWGRFRGSGWTTIGAFAVSCGYNPEQVTDAQLLATVVRPLTLWNGTGDEPFNAKNFRQLFWDCIQAHLADTRQRYDPRAEDMPIRMAEPDREHRREAFVNEMRGAIPDVMQDDLEPAHWPENELYDRFRTNRLGPYMGPAEFPTLQQELVHKGQKKKGKAQAAGHALWKIITGEEMEEERVEADTSEQHLLEYALKRRGIVLETTGLMSYLKHEEWRQHLFRSMRQEIVYQGEAVPGIPDILKADKRILRRP